ncbi:hydantoinase/carbamoylase family amidase [Siccirubricoccus sp. G192]|uniref:hydantoinase/carbamoylase family amidase n=1 Tax=Siccirubricoccus sp. G192 TaxID=2849651 RepID=UPI0028123F88|nr:hydantoinase/carbamoylase family amidase [Siccirubricoccus sp. G192]
MTPARIAAAVAAQRPLVQRLLDGVAEIGADPPGITRDAFGPGENQAQALVAEAARGLGLVLASDAAANLAMTWPGADRSAPRLMIGSHLDSVLHGGNFDGAAGVLAGLAAIAALRGLGLRPRQDITLLATRCEEAVWFQLGLIGSRAALGLLPVAALGLPRTGTGRSLADHIRDCGGEPEALAAGTRLIEPATVRAFLEVHIEQAPQLVEADAAIAVCTGIPGNIRHPRIRITGEDAHVGLPRRFRRDAALAGADLALALEALWREEEVAGRAMACTIGRFHTLADRHAMTVVPGGFEMSLDLRAYEAGHLAALEQRLHGIVARIAAARGVTIDLGERNAGAVGQMDPGIRAGLADAAARLGIAQHPLGSPASHDAADFAAAGIPTGMLLVRNRNGSHNPHEEMETADLMAAIAVLAVWLAEAGCEAA